MSLLEPEAPVGFSGVQSRWRTPEAASCLHAAATAAAAHRSLHNTSLPRSHDKEVRIGFMVSGVGETSQHEAFHHAMMSRRRRRSHQSLPPHHPAASSVPSHQAPPTDASCPISTFGGKIEVRRCWTSAEERWCSTATCSRPIRALLISILISILTSRLISD